MEMIERLPTMPDPELKVLLANARRLGDSGAAKQQDAANALIPLIEAEMADRKAKTPAAEKKPRKAAVPKAKVAKSKARVDVEAEAEPEPEPEPEL